jgi:alanyl aminopeptidase
VKVPGTAVPVRILALRGKSTWAGYAQRITPPLFADLVGYFGGPVPFPKIDFLAVPYFSGAMENPGLITVSASILLQDPARKSIGRQRLAALVIAHELVHLWLGDLVTMHFWDDLWLNEGSATWLAARVLQRWNPAQKWSVHEVASTLEAMAVDSQLDAPPVRHKISDPDDVRAAFDPISYKKGGALFGMLEAWIGADRFRTILREYVEANADGNVSVKELLAAFPQTPGQNPAPWLRTFLDQPGVPEIEARLECAKDGARIELSQSRYLTLAAEARARAEHRAQTWRIPLCARYGDRSGTQRACTTLTVKTGSVALPRCPRWIYPNADERGYYRLRLPAAELGALASLGPSPLTEREVVGLAGNAVAMLTSGHTEIAHVMPLLRVLARERNLAATRILATSFAHVWRAVINQRTRPRYAAFVRKLYAKRARVLGLHAATGEDEETTQMRPLVLSLAGRLGRDPWTLARARRLTEKWLDTGTGIEANLLRHVLAIAASAGDRRLFDRLQRALASADERTRAGRMRRQTLLAAMGGFASPALLRRSVALVMADGATPSDLTILFQAILENPHAGKLGLDLLTEVQAQLEKDGRPHTLQRTAYLALVAGQRACSREELDVVERVAETGSAGRKPDWLIEGLEETRRDVAECIAFRARHQAGADAYFK